MEENKNDVRLGDDIADDLKQVVNQELSDMGKMLISVISKFVKEKIQGINLDELFSKKNEECLLTLWSDQLAKKGLIPQVYAGLPEELLIDNMHQEGYVRWYIYRIYSCYNVFSGQRSSERFNSFCTR